MNLQKVHTTSTENTLHIRGHSQWDILINASSYYKIRIERLLYEEGKRRILPVLFRSHENYMKL